jgi:hypothetical protein
MEPELGAGANARRHERVAEHVESDASHRGAADMRGRSPRSAARRSQRSRHLDSKSVASVVDCAELELHTQALGAFDESPTRRREPRRDDVPG